MGVDAEMFVRIKGRNRWLAEREVIRKGFEIGSCVGPDAFLTLLPDELYAGQKLRRALNIIAPITPEEAADYQVPDLVGKVVWHQDGDPIIADDDEQFIKLSLRGRYYGPGYERGDWPTIRAAIEWCRYNLPGEVWYGGDSSGICAEHMTPEAVAAIDEHFFKEGHRPYRGGFKISHATAPNCLLCDEPMEETGWGSSETLHFCMGCSRRSVTREDGTSYTVRRREEWHDARKRVEQEAAAA